ncbi:MAG: dockerin type I domain-containing protein [Bacilli bacterium]
MKKSNIIMFVITFFMFFVYINVNADTYGSIVGNSVRVRDNYNVNSNVLTEYSNGTQVFLYDTTKYVGSGCNEGWYKIRYQNNGAYICSSFIKVLGSVSYSNTTYSTAPFDARLITSQSMPIRSSASEYSTPVDYAISGTSFNIINVLPEGAGCNNKWYNVSFKGNSKGYICGSYIELYDNMVLKKDVYTSEENAYIASLKAKGFPDSYIPYLLKLHKDFPLWNFQAKNNNLVWDDVINGESGKNYLQSKEINYITNPIEREVGGWYTATDGVNAFYIDPRNFLNKYFIFMFEQLSYNKEVHSPALLGTMFQNLYLNSNEFIGYFMGAAASSNVSPVHLAARALQEGAGNPNYGMVSGNYNRTYRGYSLKGFYNFFNIGSHADAYTNEPGDRGLAYACGAACGFSNNDYRPWNTPKKAIDGGASWIANGYINAGQDTLYFQKFNTAVQYYYTHQFQTNVQSAVSESRKMYYSYNDKNLLNYGYTFVIPVYSNMPKYVSLPVIGDSNNYLSDIKINGIRINTFDRDVTEYTHYLTNDNKKVTIEGILENNKSKLSGNNTYEINGNTLSVILKVTSETGEVKEYKVNIILVDGTKTLEDIFSKLSVKVTNNYITNISSSSIAGDIISNINKVDPNATIRFSDSNGNVLSPGNEFATGNRLTVTTTSNESMEYTIVVNGDTSCDGKVTILDLLKVQKHIIKSNTLTNEQALAADTNGDQKVDILDLLRVQKNILGLLKL